MATGLTNYPSSLGYTTSVFGLPWPSSVTMASDDPIHLCSTEEVLIGKLWEMFWAYSKHEAEYEYVFLWWGAGPTEQSVNVGVNYSRIASDKTYCRCFMFCSKISNVNKILGS